MPNTVPAATETALRAQLNRLPVLGWGISPAFSQAIQSSLAALDYQDPALMRSHLNAALDAMRTFVADTIRERLETPRHVQETWRRIWDMLKQSPAESYDDVGRAFESHFNDLLGNLTALREGPVRLLQEHGHEVEQAPQLDRVIHDLRKLKQDIFEDWPWSHQALPPVDRAMVAASRASIARGEGEPVEDLIRRLGGTPVGSN